MGVASDYLDVCSNLTGFETRSNYRSLVLSTRRGVRARGRRRSSQIEVDQSLQRELDARRSWVAARRRTIGASTRSRFHWACPRMRPSSWIAPNLKNWGNWPRRWRRRKRPTKPRSRLPAADAPGGVAAARPRRRGRMRSTLTWRSAWHSGTGRICAWRWAKYDAQRMVAVAADQLRADLTLLGTVRAGTGRWPPRGRPTRSCPGRGVVLVLLTLDLPLERTAEQDAYRTTLIGLEQSVRAVQSFEDQIKLSGADRLGELLEAREAIQDPNDGG